MKCQSLFSEKIKKIRKNIVSLSSAEFTQRIVKVKTVPSARSMEYNSTASCMYHCGLIPYFRKKGNFCLAIFNQTTKI